MSSAGTVLGAHIDLSACPMSAFLPARTCSPGLQWLPVEVSVMWHLAGAHDQSFVIKERIFPALFSLLDFLPSSSFWHLIPFP